MISGFPEPDGAKCGEKSDCGVNETPGPLLGEGKGLEGGEESECAKQKEWGEQEEQHNSENGFHIWGECRVGQQGSMH